MILESDLGYHSIEENIILSKAFPHLMKPSQIIPYYYRASGVFDKDDITVTSLITSNRFEALARLVERYQGMLGHPSHCLAFSLYAIFLHLGPISVTFHINNATENVPQLLESLHHLYTTTSNMATYVDVHLVLDTFERQFNTWRNVARLFARTDYVMMLDVDFYLCTPGFREVFRRTVWREGDDVKEMFRNGLAAFVIPAFEYVNYDEGREVKAFPKTKKVPCHPVVCLTSRLMLSVQNLVQLVQERRIGMFHATWPPGHNSTNYERYYAAKQGEMYKVTQFQSYYEPYTIFRKDGPPWFVPLFF